MEKLEKIILKLEGVKFETPEQENRCRYYQYCLDYNPAKAPCQEYDNKDKLRCYNPSEVGY